MELVFERHGRQLTVIGDVDGLSLKFEQNEDNLIVLCGRRYPRRFLGSLALSLREGGNSHEFKLPLGDREMGGFTTQLLDAEGKRSIGLNLSWWQQSDDFALFLRIQEAEKLIREIDSFMTC